MILLSDEELHKIVKPRNTKRRTVADILWLPMIDTRDISDAGARVLTTPGHEHKTYNLTGVSAITLHDIATALSTALSKPIKYPA